MFTDKHLLVHRDPQGRMQLPAAIKNAKKERLVEVAARALACMAGSREAALELLGPHLFPLPTRGTRHMLCPCEADRADALLQGEGFEWLELSSAQLDTRQLPWAEEADQKLAWCVKHSG